MYTIFIQVLLFKSLSSQCDLVGFVGELLYVCELTGVEGWRSIAAPYSVKEPCQHSHPNPQSTGTHRRNLRPTIRLGVISSAKRQI